MQFLPLALMALQGGQQFLNPSQGELKSPYSSAQKKAMNQFAGQFGNLSGMDVTQAPGYQTGLNFLQNMFTDPGFFQQMEAPAMRQFQEQITPQIANRFAGMGSGGSLGSTGFRNVMAREGQNLASNLAAMRGQMQMQSIPQLLGYSQAPAQNILSAYGGISGSPYYQMYQPPTSGPFGPMTSQFLGGMAGQYGQNFANQYFPMS